MGPRRLYSRHGIPRYGNVKYPHFDGTEWQYELFLLCHAQLLRCGQWQLHLGRSVQLYHLVFALLHDPRLLRKLGCHDGWRRPWLLDKNSNRFGLYMAGTIASNMERSGLFDTQLPAHVFVIGDECDGCFSNVW